MPMPLGKQIFFAGVAASGGGAIVYYLVQKMFSRASYYQLALEQLHSHPEALEALGTPLNVHYLRLTDKYNFVDIADAKLKIPVSGPKSEGHLYVSSSRDAPFKRYDGKVGGEQEENLLLETILISLFNCSCMIAALRISFTKLQKFHSQDNTHADAFALSSVRTFSPVLTTGSEEL
ncbi:cytochrome c oxidase assembly factor 1 homolog isoform X2 [Ovis aries]|nr:cytochrome c oxidase assembly factor 1 homolog isoform X2 [Ovis aries]XP_060270779.1 cytochrome c oxidase assembly factor 1 homolog isoform X2 [Ovis aries]XP_060270780.1 cytochrome c oxidase assembly factor 1 homolog isoform X2 [Ovis aries]XP_060270782.1 cytochrome c oxidase assembly factor 1 homolog isoform X2 [Ovis aries]